MKIKNLYLLAAIFAVPLIFYSVTSAQNAASRELPSSAAPITANTQPDNERSQRIQQRKANASRRFSMAEQNIIRGKCQAVHGVVRATDARFKSFEAKRLRVYDGLVARLERLNATLTSAGADTAEYDTQVAALKRKTEAYTAALAAFKQSLADLVAMDCTSDPEGFAVTLLEARTLREHVITTGKDTRGYLKDTLKPTLVNLKQGLKDKAAGENGQ